MLPRKEISKTNDQQKTLEQGRRPSGWNITKDSTVKTANTLFPKTKEGTALQNAIERYYGGERRHTSDSFSSIDAKILIKDLKDANITSHDIDETINILKSKSPIHLIKKWL